MDDMNLLPKPRNLSVGAPFSLPAAGRIAVDSAAAQALRITIRSLQAALREHVGLHWEIATDSSDTESDGTLRLHLVPESAPHPQGYRLTITPDRIDLFAPTAAGIYYGGQTLGQLLARFGRRLPTLRCQDWPDFPHRGVMLDISRDKVPTMETLYELVDLLASWKINQFQLYTEHTFAYRNHRTVWANASPITAQQIRALDAYCRERFIELVPNQNSFGHMRRWLIHDRYRPLAECPDGCDTIWGHFDQPFTLCPGDPASLELLRELYDELLPNFGSGQFNVGCDETVDLGQGRSQELSEQIGVGRVYLDFLLQIYHEVKARGRTMQFWGDVIISHPELVDELPHDLIALEWGYEANHPFAKHGAALAEAGIPFYVCPGTSSWNAIAGRTDNALENLRNAAENGLRHGAIGYLTTDWGDNGHWQPLPVSHLGFGYGAAVSWAYQANCDLAIADVASSHVFGDTGRVMGQLAYDLGNVYQTTGILSPNSTILFRTLQATPKVIANHIRLEGKGLAARLQATVAELDAIIARLPEATMQRSDGPLVRREFAWAGRMLRHACERMLWVMGEYPVERLARGTSHLLTEHHAIWHARNRPGGFQDSQARLQRMVDDYRAPVHH